MAIKKEVLFGIDNFKNNKVLSEKESIAQMILNLFFLRPGNIPSLPDKGININKYLYSLEDSIDVDELKEKIYTQCSDLAAHVSIGDIKVLNAPYEGHDYLLIIIPITSSEGEENLVLGFSKEDNEILYNYQFIDSSQISFN